MAAKSPGSGPTVFLSIPCKLHLVASDFSNSFSANIVPSSAIK